MRAVFIGDGTTVPCVQCFGILHEHRHRRGWSRPLDTFAQVRHGLHIPAFVVYVHMCVYVCVCVCVYMVCVSVCACVCVCTCV